MTAKPTVHVVDDDAATRDAMQELFKSVAISSRCYEDPSLFLQEIQPEHPGCIVLDLRMPGMSGLEVQVALHEKRCNQPVIFITGHGKISAAVRAMHGGAVDFLTKPVDDETLLKIVQEAIQQDNNQSLAHEEREKIITRLASLTPREREVVEYVTRGLSNKEIARELDISHKTVELHRAHMMDKMDAHSIAEVVQMYLLGSGNLPDTLPSE